jgi:hypothetical protein
MESVIQHLVIEISENCNTNDDSHRGLLHNFGGVYSKNVWREEDKRLADVEGFVGERELDLRRCG